MICELDFNAVEYLTSAAKAVEHLTGALFNIVISLLTPFVAWLTYRFQRRKEKWLALQSLLSRRLEINKQIISNDSYLKAHEQLVTGEENPNTGEAEKRFIVFHYLNQMLYIFRAKRDGLMDEDVANSEVDAVLYLLLPSQSLVKKLLNSRGYTDDFRRYIKGRSIIRDSNLPIIWLLLRETGEIDCMAGILFLRDFPLVKNVFSIFCFGFCGNRNNS